MLSGESFLKILAAVCLLGCTPISVTASNHPTAELNNGKLHAKIYLPDASSGFYRGTRFDWSGVIYSLQSGKHAYYGPWFTKTGAQVHDFVYDGDDIVAGPCSAITGPVDEFAPLGWDQAQPGATFLKIGIGSLRRPDTAAYDNYRLYEIADAGKWTTARPAPDSIVFTQTVTDVPAGYGYVYRKTIHLLSRQSEMSLEHSLTNTGARPIETKVYNHNFLVLDGQTPGPGTVITLPFSIQSARPPNAELAQIQGKQIVYLKPLQGKDVVAMPIEGFGINPSDHFIRIENSRAKAGMQIMGDRPLLSASLWSIRSVLSIEPFVAISIAPGHEFTWKATYRYYDLPE